MFSQLKRGSSLRDYGPKSTWCTMVANVTMYIRNNCTALT
jgi:hypothetical protein